MRGHAGIDGIGELDVILLVGLDDSGGMNSGGMSSGGMNSGSIFGSSNSQSNGSAGGANGMPSVPGLPGSTAAGGGLTGGAGEAGPIIGVTVPLKKASILVYRKKKVYDKWQFVYNPQDEITASVGQGGGQAPGAGNGTPAGASTSGGIGGSNTFGSSNSGMGSSSGGIGSSSGGIGSSSSGLNSSSSGFGSSPSGSNGSSNDSSSNQNQSNPFERILFRRQKNPRLIGARVLLFRDDDYAKRRYILANTSPFQTDLYCRLMR